MKVLLIIISLIASYFLGAIPFGYFIGKTFCHVNLLKEGSGNVGATNTMRVLGPKYGIVVFLLDFFKGFGCALLGYLVAGTVLSVFCGLLAVLGHTFSVFLNFKGGKGVATGAGMMLCWCPPAILIALLIWVVILYLTGFVSLSSIVAAISCFVLLILFKGTVLEIIVCGIIVAYVIYKHKDNIKRLINHKENRFDLRTPVNKYINKIKNHK